MCKWYVLYLLSLLWRRSEGTLPLSVGKLTHLNARSRLSLWFEDRSRVTFPSKWRIACCIFSSAWIYLKVCSIANNSEKNMCVVKFFSDIAYKVCNLQKTMRGFRDRSNTVHVDFCSFLKGRNQVESIVENPMSTQARIRSPCFIVNHIKLYRLCRS